MSAPIYVIIVEFSDGLNGQICFKINQESSFTLMSESGANTSRIFAKLSN